MDKEILNNIDELLIFLEKKQIIEKDISRKIQGFEDIYYYLKNKESNISEKKYWINHLIEVLGEKLFIEEKNNWERQGMDLGLDRIKEMLNILDNPQDKLNIIHIGGTNGKGSTSIFIQSILMESGLDIGFFSSPAIISENESIRINNNYIDYSKAYDLLIFIKNTWEENFNREKYLTYFEAFTILGILYFKEKEVDIAIFEVGLGGRFDSTNIFSKKLASVITNIGLDHIGVLGGTIEEIAYEKAGIIQEKDYVFAYPSPNEAVKIVKDVSAEKKAKLNILSVDDIDIKSIESDYNEFSYRGHENLKTKMVGEHQIYNCSLAIMVIDSLNERKIFNITDEDIKSGVLKAKWPGRLEWLVKNPRVLIDGAHNVDAIENLVKFLQNEKYDNLRVLMGILKDKEHDKIFEMLASLPAKFYLTEVPFEGRKMKVEEMEEELQKYTNEIKSFENSKEAVDTVFKDSKDEDLIVITGSLYLISEIRGYILKIGEEFL